MYVNNLLYIHNAGAFTSLSYHNDMICATEWSHTVAIYAWDAANRKLRLIMYEAGIITATTDVNQVVLFNY